MGGWSRDHGSLLDSLPNQLVARRLRGVISPIKELPPGNAGKKHSTDYEEITQLGILHFLYPVPSGTIYIILMKIRLQ